MQLWYAGNFVSIELFYGYTSTTTRALAATRVLYTLASLVEAETGMQAFDPQIGQLVAIDRVEEAAARYRGVGEGVRGVVEARQPRT